MKSVTATLLTEVMDGDVSANGKPSGPSTQMIAREESFASGWMIKRAPRWGRWFTRFFTFGYQGFAYFRGDPAANDRTLSHSRIVEPPIRCVSRYDISAWCFHSAKDWWVVDARGATSAGIGQNPAESTLPMPVTMGLVSESLDIHKDELWQRKAAAFACAGRDLSNGRSVKTCLRTIASRLSDNSNGKHQQQAQNPATAPSMAIQHGMDDSSRVKPAQQLWTPPVQLLPASEQAEETTSTSSHLQLPVYSSGTAAEGTRHTGQSGAGPIPEGAQDARTARCGHIRLWLRSRVVCRGCGGEVHRTVPQEFGRLGAGSKPCRCNVS